MSWLWMQHDQHGGKAQFPAASAADWETRGWRECEAPPEPDILHDHPADTDADTSVTVVKTRKAATHG